MFRTAIAKTAAVATLALVALAGLAATTAQNATGVEARPITAIAHPAEDLIWG
ncbi:hypothetical protein [Kitasatospora purpeofusca]|uniref:hypothetical protein n=1 Tax=Kitasatospora purpeofusca TaxID=67352 RepID=UPI002A59F4F9|nr:hypothetical protein [Kitasatospora purpeofusca]MDY0809782.1 hypothetical protein [Kitasatospora purpeofusca]